ncbi:DELTA-stichotoxin-She4a-like [Dendronephthya gigantea]|uniref:DELTA-stichotoxin-She4a-like n=1 Tax=Dendronephthya gigantea TaxID=151771 RepID=UPI00106C374C|nr:DELTA-stichotoxin-She4a-like [Dendronephthya gigantea]
MAGKLMFLALLATLALVAVRAEDDFKDVEDAEEELEYMESKDDEESVDRAPRLFGRRSSSFRSTRRGTSFRNSGSSGTRSGFFRTRSSGGVRSGTTRTNRSPFRRSTSTTRNTQTRRFSFRRSTRTGGNTGGGGGTSGWEKLGQVTDLAQFGLEVANTVLQQLANVERKIVITLGNVEGAPWQGGTAYMKEGSLTEALPLNVPVEEGFMMGGVKKTGPSTTGVSGAFCYGFEEAPESFCVMFKLPWSGDNKWNVKVYPEQKQASESVYNDLQNGATNANQPITKKVIYTGDGYQFFIKDVSMTSSPQATLSISFGVE